MLQPVANLLYFTLLPTIFLLLKSQLQEPSSYTHEGQLKTYSEYLVVDQ